MGFEPSWEAVPSLHNKQFDAISDAIPVIKGGEQAKYPPIDVLVGDC